MFLPMSCTSPLTVAIRILPAFLCTPPVAFFSASMNGSRYATAFFITRALLTTCGRNILPAPNKSPTTLMPAMSGPSMTRSGRTYFCRASSTSVSIKSAMPFTSAWLRRSRSEIADDAHAGHERAFDDEKRPDIFLPRFFNVGINKIRDAFYQRMAEAFLDRAFAPFVFDDLGFSLLLHRLGEFYQALSDR